MIAIHGIHCTIATKIVRVGGEVVVYDLVCAITSEARPVFASFQLFEAQEKDHNLVVNRFNTYFVPRYNVIHECTVFNELVQNIMGLRRETDICTCTLCSLRNL